MTTLRILDGSGHTTMTEETHTTAEMRAAWDKAIVEEHKVPFDADTKEPISKDHFPEESENVLLIAPIAGG